MSSRILVIEDNAANLELLSYLLSAHGHVTLTARDGYEGLDAARQERPNLIVCDIQLPGMDGYGVARNIKADEALRAIPLVAVTAFAMVGDGDKVLAAGFGGYISKPIDPETFVPQVEAFLPEDPRTPPPTPAVSSYTASPTPTKGATILVVDDAPVLHSAHLWTHFHVISPAPCSSGLTGRFGVDEPLGFYLPGTH